MISTGAIASQPEDAYRSIPESPPSFTGDVPMSEEDEGDPFLSLARSQYALAIAAAAGLRGVATAFERFLRDLADSSKVDEAESVQDLARELPTSLLSATATGLETTERIPEQLLERYRRYRDSGEKR